MGNRMSSLRRNWRRIAVTGVATLGIVGLSAGTGYTAAQIGSAGIKNQSIKSWDIGHNQVGSSELRGPAHNKGPAVWSWHIKNGEVNTWDLSQEVRDGLGGEKGEDGVSGYNVDGPTKIVRKGYQEITLECPTDGKVALSGGLRFDSGGGYAKDIDLQTSYPSGLTQAGDDSWRASSWTVGFHSNVDGLAVQPFVVCASAN